MIPISNNKKINTPLIDFCSAESSLQFVTADPHTSYHNCSLTFLLLYSFNFLYKGGKGKGKFHPITGHEDPEVEKRYGSTYSLTSAPDEVGGQRHTPAALPPGKNRYPLYRGLGGPRGRSGRVRKIFPPPGFDPRTIQPVASRCTDRKYSSQINILVLPRPTQLKHLRPTVTSKLQHSRYVNRKVCGTSDAVRTFYCPLNKAVSNVSFLRTTFPLVFFSYISLSLSFSHSKEFTLILSLSPCRASIKLCELKT